MIAKIARDNPADLLASTRPPARRAGDVRPLSRPRQLQLRRSGRVLRVLAAQRGIVVERAEEPYRPPQAFPISNAPSRPPTCGLADAYTPTPIRGADSRPGPSE